MTGIPMLDWYLNLSLTERALSWLLLGAAVFFSYRAFLALRHSHVAWYRGFHSSPLFQVFIWIFAIPLVLPAALLVRSRLRRLERAPLIGNIYSRVYHLRECEYQQRISSIFKRYPLVSNAEALERGFKPCAWCQPELSQ